MTADADVRSASAVGFGDFTAVFDRYFGDVYRYVAARLGPQVAEDVAAETFLVAYRRRGRFDAARGQVRPWLYGIATNLVARHRRAEARHFRALARAGVEPPAGSCEDEVVTAVAARRMRPALARALATLTAGERDVLLLVALGQLSHEDIATALGVAPGTVGSRLNRARGKLRRILDREAFHG
ncbi:RNA polymerase sigma factor [Fodinicola acaciae]|uniref:RNA polymerase sigma factor n=1 Tax=Fodinicola acaciae TaxID=2681555 RepID=UPI0013D185EE|nr:RNA polymerase sigma factor [Fodinicola acaciae]